MTYLDWLNGTVETAMLAVSLLVVGIVVLLYSWQIRMLIGTDGVVPDRANPGPLDRVLSLVIVVAGSVFILAGATFAVFTVIRILARVLAQP